METIHLDDFLTNGILKEKDFRKKVEDLEWNQYKNRRLKFC